MKFIKTVASIDELKPFEETEADATAIAGNIWEYQASLVPKKSEPKYSNMNEAERKVWQNIIIPYAIEREKSLQEFINCPKEWYFILILAK